MTETERLLRHRPSDAEIHAALTRASQARNEAYRDAFKAVGTAVRSLISHRPYLTLPHAMRLNPTFGGREAAC